jgi:hypothetical protein
MRDHRVYEKAEHVQYNDAFFINFFLFCFLLYPRGVGPIT